MRKVVNMLQQTMSQSVKSGWQTANEISAPTPVFVSTAMPEQRSASWVMHLNVATKNDLPDWIFDPSGRHDYMSACLEQDVAWQVRINRQRRSMSQEDLAKATGTGQSAISRAEDPSYGKHSIATLAKIAEAFDCALLLKFVSFERFAEEIRDVSEEALFVAPFEGKR
jgi:DNA-binding XRE family transcriptional regulator